MADPPIPEAQIPLLNSGDQIKNQKPGNPEIEVEKEEDLGSDDLDKTLRRIESMLTLLGFNQRSALSFALSWVVFSLVGVSLPVVVLELSNCKGCEAYQIKDFEVAIVVFQACLGAVSLLCVSHNLRKYGIRKFLFVDRYNSQMSRFHDEYIHKIRDSVRLIVLWVLPGFLLKTAREVVRTLYEHHESWLLSVAILLALIVSWTYVSTIYLTACVIFHLACNLQIIHFDDYGKFMERHSDVMTYIEEHIRLRHYLAKISHRFRICLLLVFLVVTASQFVTLFLTTGYSGTITFINGGDFAVSSIVQVVGTILCLNAAAKISHRAQGIASLASKWHATVTCSPTDTSQLRVSNSTGSLDSNSMGSLRRNNSESDLESLDGMVLAANTHPASHMSLYHKRQAFVMYLQMNPGGITIFGWTVDRGLVNTIFFIELSLVLFVLGKTIVSAGE